MMWPFRAKPKRWGNEYRIARREFCDGRVSFDVEKNSHAYGMWFPQAHADTEEKATAEADRLYAAWVSRQTKYHSVVKL